MSAKSSLLLIVAVESLIVGCSGALKEDGQDASVLAEASSPHDTGLVSNPGFVSCGTASCDVGGDGGAWCSFGLDPDSSRYCIEGPCSDAARPDFSLGCDEPADCDAMVTPYCCWGGDNLVRSHCPGSGCNRMPCDNYGPVGIPLYPELCKTDDDCADAGPCILQPCALNAFGLCGVLLSPTCGF